MTINDQVLKQKLTEHIQKWADKVCDSNEWADTDIIVHPDFTIRMADAAYAVFQAMYESQEYAKSN